MHQGEVFIETDMATKSYTIQEDDMLDPNITGGTAHLIMFRISMKGTASDDGHVKLYLKNINTGDIVEDANGQPMAVVKAFKTDDTLGVMYLNRHCKSY